MRARQPRRPHVLIIPFLPMNRLLGPIDELHLRPVAPRPIPSTRPLPRLQQRHIISELFQFIGRNQPTNPSAQHHHLDALPRSCSRLDRRHLLSLHRHQPERLHRRKRSAKTTNLSNPHQEITARNTHGKDTSLSTNSNGKIRSIRSIQNTRTGPRSAKKTKLQPRHRWPTACQEDQPFFENYSYST